MDSDPYLLGTRYLLGIYSVLVRRAIFDFENTAGASDNEKCDQAIDVEALRVCNAVDDVERRLARGA